jgi:methanogenic corrinoid protein MtbC1
MKANPKFASEAVLGQRTEIAAALVDREIARLPNLRHRDGVMNREQLLEEAGVHLSYLAQALALDRQSIFTDYVAWARVLLAQRKVPESELAFHLESLAALLRERLPAETGPWAADFVTAAVHAMPTMPEDLPSLLPTHGPLAALAQQYFHAVRRGERRLAGELVLTAVEAGTPVRDLYLHVFQPAQHEIGRLWQTNRITVAEEHYCTAATQLIMSQLYPRIFATTKNGLTLVATCVAGDLHEIGVRMVADLFEMDGWDTYYLGANTPHRGVVATVVEREADVLAISATISYHVDAVRDLIRTVRQHPLVSKVKILVGGYPFNRNSGLWQAVGADGSAADGDKAIALAHELLKTRRA